MLWGQKHVIMQFWRHLLRFTPSFVQFCKRGFDFFSHLFPFLYLIINCVRLLNKPSCKTKAAQANIKKTILNDSPYFNFNHVLYSYTTKPRVTHTLTEQALTGATAWHLPLNPISEYWAGLGGLFSLPIVLSLLHRHDKPWFLLP